MSETEATGQMSDAQLDATFDAIENGNYNDPDVQETAPQEQVQEQAQPQQTQEQFFEFNYKGKPVRLAHNDPKLVRLLEKGYGFNDYHQELSSKIQAAEEKVSRYAQVDEWARQNPDQWQTILALHEKATQGQLTENQNTELTVLEQKLRQEMQQVLKPILDERQQRIYQEQDKALDTEIQSVREKYPDLDLEAAEEDGQTPMYKVLEFANQNGIRNFETAFKALYHEKLLKIAETKALEKHTKERQKQTKMGLLGKTPTPSKGLKPAQNYREKSYEELFKEGYEELGS